MEKISLPVFQTVLATAKNKIKSFFNSCASTLYLLIKESFACCYFSRVSFLGKNQFVKNYLAEYFQEISFSLDVYRCYSQFTNLAISICTCTNISCLYKNVFIYTFFHAYMYVIYIYISHTYIYHIKMIKKWNQVIVKNSFKNALHSSVCK